MPTLDIELKNPFTLTKNKSYILDISPIDNPINGDTEYLKALAKILRSGPHELTHLMTYNNDGSKYIGFTFTDEEIQPYRDNGIEFPADNEVELRVSDFIFNGCIEHEIPPLNGGRLRTSKKARKTKKGKTSKKARKSRRHH
jgi:hypothetical protein